MKPPLFTAEEFTPSDPNADVWYSCNEAAVVHGGRGIGVGEQRRVGILAAMKPPLFTAEEAADTRALMASDPQAAMKPPLFTAEELGELGIIPGSMGALQ